MGKFLNNNNFGAKDSGSKKKCTENFKKLVTDQYWSKYLKSIYFIAEYRWAQLKCNAARHK